MTYIEYVCNAINNIDSRVPIYTKQMAEKAAQYYDITVKEAASAISVALKRIMDNGTIPELRFYQKGVYYKTVVTPFGEAGIKKDRIIADKYILPNIGYETGLSVMHKMGLTTQMPNKRVIVTNVAKDCIRTDKKLDIMIKPPKTEVNAENKYYLQTLDVLEMMDKAPIDEQEPYVIIANHIEKQNLRYDKLLALADIYYNQKTILQLAHIASAGGVRI